MDEAAPPVAAPTTGGFVVEISCLPDGTFSVSSEPLEEEAAEEQGAPGSEKGRPAKSVGEALKLALQLIQAGGSNGDDEFAEGYSGGTPAAEQQEETAELTPGVRS